MKTIQFHISIKIIIEILLKGVNKYSKNIKFILEKEEENRINF